LQLELEQLNEKVSALTTELTSIKEETTGKISFDTGAVATIETKQLQAENARMREALLK